MGKRTIFTCINCSCESPKWLGKCPTCGQWNTFVEQAVAPTPAARRSSQPRELAAPLVAEAEENRAAPRMAIGRPEMDRLFGGGVVPGSLVLLGGEPGAGKSTLLLQIAALLAKKHGRILYVSAEESLTQVRLRAARLGISTPELFLLPTDQIEAVREEVARLNPIAVVLDSIQTLKTTDHPGLPGTPLQVREVVQSMMGLVKEQGMICFLVGHITKSGNLAGPKLIEHLVDVVLYFEGDRRYPYRVLRVVKNRFSSTREIALLSMGDKASHGSNPSSYLLAERCPQQAARWLPPLLRSLPLMNQALVTTGNAAAAVGWTGLPRVAMVLAVLERRAGFPFQQEVYVSVIESAKNPCV